MDKHQNEQLIQEMYEEMNEVTGTEDEEEFISDTTYEAHQVLGDRQFYTGSVKITKKLQTDAKLAIQSRFKSVASYHEGRLKVLQQSWELYSSTFLETDSITKMFYPEIYNSCEDWIDDLVGIFSKFVDYLEVTDQKCDLESYITKSLEIEEPDFQDGMIQMFMSFVKEIFGKEETKRNTTYYFQKKDLIKSFIKWGVSRSGFDENNESFFEYGVIGGSFITKDEYCLDETDYQIQYNKEGDGDQAVYNSVFDPKMDPTFKFLPIDPRRIIAPNCSKPSWAAEEFDTTVSEILSECTDEKGKQKAVSKYDLASVKKMIAWLKENRQDEKSENPDRVDGEVTTEQDDTQDQKWLDAQVKLYEIHWIPLILPDQKRPVKTRLYAINLIDSLEESNIFLIGAEPTPHVVSFPYHCTQYLTKDREWFGTGLPIRLNELQDLLNTVNNHYVDLMKLGLWGIMLIDPEKIENASALEQIRERMVIQVKNLRGRPVTDIVSWLHPPIENMRLAEGYLDRLIDIVRRTSRKGPVGEKVAPDPSATEFSSMVEEMKKSVNRTSLRINKHLVNWCHRMYKYYLLNYKNYFTFRAESYRLFGLKEDEFAMQLKVGALDQIRDKYRKTSKYLELTPRELIVEGINFKCEAFEYHQKEAIERQQTMQAVDLLYSKNAIKSPDGLPNIFIDDAGSPVIISEFKLLRKAMKALNMNDVFEPASKYQNSQQNQPVQGIGGPDPTRVPGSGPSMRPPLSKSPKTADTLGQASLNASG